MDTADQIANFEIIAKWFNGAIASIPDSIDGDLFKTAATLLLTQNGARAVKVSGLLPEMGCGITQYEVTVTGRVHTLNIGVSAFQGRYWMYSLSGVALDMPW